MAGADGAVLRTVPFITLRNKTGSHNALDYFGDERGDMRAGYCDVSSTPVKLSRPIAEKIPYFIPEDRERLAAIRETGIEDLWQNMERASNEQGPTLYLHGF